ncbi:MAG: PorP/SprF family type IX secretion system membrane protein [Bacteroidetes bacterium]|nr:PorP/SprF family type IX secretion system membrane protein [Bacteroidota bacterium]
MKKIIILSAIVFALPFWKDGDGLRAQDFHLSQFDAAPHYFNPAITGIYFGKVADYRIYSDYRSQWRSLGVKPFSTFFIAYDMPYKEYGLGGYLIQNRNGPGGLNTINFMPSASYKITKEANSPHNLSVGAQMGILYKSFDPNNFTYDNQVAPEDPSGFNHNLLSGENFNKTSIVKFDANMGVFYKYKKPEWQAHPFFGYSVYHVTKPNQSLTGITKDRIPMRWVLQGGAEYKINEEINIRPTLLFMNQGRAHELNIGSIGFYHLKDTKYDVMGGLNYRVKDAFIIQAGMRYEQHIFRFSYDINTSSLNNYTHGKGAFEFSILLTGIKGKPMFNPPKFLNVIKNKPL